MQVTKPESPRPQEIFASSIIKMLRVSMSDEYEGKDEMGQQMSNRHAHGTAIHFKNSRRCLRICVSAWAGCDCLKLATAK